MNFRAKVGPFQCFVLLLVAIGGCQSKRSDGDAPSGRKLTVIVAEEELYERPDRQSEKVATLPFGRKVTAIERKRPASAQNWEEVHVEQGLSGFVRSSALGTAELVEKLRELMESVEGLEPQASGVTSAAANFRLAPGREAQVIEKLPTGTRFEMFERRATFWPPRPHPKADGAEEPKGRKEIWYKVRLPDGRVGYIYTRILKFEPPTELAQYTRFRRTVAWLKLRSLESETLGSVREYLVAYATPGLDFGADYNRVEIYVWDGQGYQTAFAQSSLRGILPIPVSREGDEIFFELRELEPKQPGQLLLRRFRFPQPIKEVDRSLLTADVGIH